jgi:hypothetical protein
MNQLQTIKKINMIQNKNTSDKKFYGALIFILLYFTIRIFISFAFNI